MKPIRYRIFVRRPGDLRVNYESDAFKQLLHAATHGTRVSTEGMSAEDIVEMLMGEGRSTIPTFLNPRPIELDDGSTSDK